MTGGAEPPARGGAGSAPARDRAAVVPPAEVRTYYDRPVIAPPAWTVEVPWYFFAGGLAGASSGLAVAARLTGRPRLARAARRSTVLGGLASPVLLILDLGVPGRFLNMLRVFRPTSPLNLGAWVVAAFAPAAVGSGLLAELDRLPRLQRLAEGVAAPLGLVMSTYTAVLASDTAVPVWHEARRELPFLFAGSAVASAGGAALLLTPPSEAAPARRLVLLGAALEQGAERAMEHRLGPLAQPYREGRPGAFARAARALTAAGAATVAVLGRRRPGAVVGGALVLAGAVCQRFAVFEAGWPSATDPVHTVEPQRRRLASRDGHTP